MKFKQTNTHTLQCMGQDISLKTHDLNHDLTFSAHKINCVCHSIRSMFRVLGMYNFGFPLGFKQSKGSSWIFQPKTSWWKSSWLKSTLSNDANYLLGIIDILAKFIFPQWIGVCSLLLQSISFPQKALFALLLLLSHHQ